MSERAARKKIYGGEVAAQAGDLLSDLEGGGAMVEVKPAKDVKDAKRYHAIVLGSAIRKGQLLPEVPDFVRTHRTDLQRVPVAFFVVCMTLKDHTDANRRIVNAYLDPLRAMVNPVDTGLFAGKMDYSTLDLLSKIIIKYFVRTPEGDYRDWKAIKSWAMALLPKLGIERKQQGGSGNSAAHGR